MDLLRSDFSEIKEFERIGYHYTKFQESENYILWRVNMDTPDWNPKWDKFELWKKVRVKNPDGSIVMRKLNDSDGGTYLWFFNSFDGFRKFLDRYPKKFPEEVSHFARYGTF